MSNPTRVRNRTRRLSIPMSQSIQYGYKSLYSYAYDVFEQIEDQVTPGYFKYVREGRPLPVNPYSIRKQELVLETPVQQWIWDHKRYPNSTIEWTSHQALMYLHKQLSGGGIVLDWSLREPSTLSIPEKRGRYDLAQEALACANTHSMDLGTFLAEFNKTLDLILGFRRRVAKRARRIRKRYPSIGVQDFQDAWMEYRYGWRILKYDVQDINEALKKLREGVGEYARCTAYAGSKRTFSSPETSATQATIGNGVDTLYATSTYPVELAFFEEGLLEQRAGVGVQLFMRDLAFVDPLVTAYELIPYSFVTDWFWNLGDALAAWSPFAGTRLKWAFYSETLTSQLRCRATQGDSAFHKGRGEVSYATAKHFVRSRHPIEPKFDFSISVHNFDLDKLRDLLSIIGPNRRRNLPLNRR